MPADYLRLSRLLDLSAENRLITNIGDANTDFVSGGGLNLAQRMLIQGTAAYGRLGQNLEVNASADYGGAAFSAWTATAAEAPLLDFNRSKSVSIGTQSAVTTNDAVGFITARGSDGSNFFTSSGIRFEVDAAVAAGIVPGRMTFRTSDAAGTGTEAMRVDSGQRLLVGQTVAYGRLGQRLETSGNTADYGGVALNTWSSVVAIAPLVDFNRSKSNTPGTYTAVVLDDVLGHLTFRGADGSAFINAAQIIAYVDNTVGANQVPGRMVFRTATSAGTMTEAMRITSTQLTRAAAASSWGLSNVAATATVPTIHPLHGTTDMGIGAASTSALSVIVGGLEVAQFDANGITATKSGAIHSIAVESYNATVGSGSGSTVAATLDLFRARGTEASFGAPRQDDYIGQIRFRGKGGTSGNHVTGGEIRMSAVNNWSFSTYESRMLFSVVPNASTTLTEAFRVDSTQLVRGANASAWGLPNVAATATVPTVLPLHGTTNTGMGANAAGQISLISNGVEYMRIDAANNAASIGPSNTPTATRILTVGGNIGVQSNNTFGTLVSVTAGGDVVSRIITSLGASLNLVDTQTSSLTGNAVALRSFRVSTSTLAGSLGTVTGAANIYSISLSHAGSGTITNFYHAYQETPVGATNNYHMQLGNTDAAQRLVRVGTSTGAEWHWSHTNLSFNFTHRLYIGGTFAAPITNANGSASNITLQQATGITTQAMSFKHADVAHSFTTLTDTNTFWDVRPASVAGGVNMRGHGSATSDIFVIQAHLDGAITTTKTTAGLSAIDMYISERSGTTFGDVTANANLFGIRARTGGAWVTGLIVDAEGDVFANSSFQGFNTSSGMLSNVAASATVPTVIPLKSATTTGLGSSGAGVLNLIAAGVDVASIAATLVTISQNILMSGAAATLTLGNETGSPKINLDKDATTGSANVNFRTATGSTRGRLHTDTAERLYLETLVGDHDIFIQTLGFANAIFVDNGAVAVGIGTTAPDSKLTVAGTISGLNASSGALLNVAASATVPTFAPLRSSPASGIGAAAANQVSIIANSVEVLRAVAGPQIFVNATANAQQTSGLTIGQAAATNEIISFQNTGVAHGATGLAATSTFAALRPNSAFGGFSLRGYAETGTNVGGSLIGYTVDNADTTKTTGGVGIMNVTVAQLSGTSDANIVADGNLFAIRGRTAGSYVSRFLFDVEGSAHADIEWIAFDDYNDVALIKDIESYLTKGRFGESMMYNRETFERVGIIGKNSMYEEVRADGTHQIRGMVNFTKLAMLHHGAIGQVSDRVETVEDRVTTLEAENKMLKSQLGALGAG